MTDIEAYTQQNRRAWNEIAEIRHKKQQPEEIPYDGHGCYSGLENAQRLPGDFLLVACKDVA
jgi:hypothetical protein